jgi:tetratricopeptide (TPR) repeat protein/transcriptional regulator with XRE-family HTH domain
LGAPETSRFGALLATLRKEAGLTQAALAERARMSQRGLQDLERGIHQAPRRDTLDLLAAALGLSAPDRAAFMAVAQGKAPAQPGPAAPPPLGSIDALVPLVGRVPEQAVLDRFLAGEAVLGGAPRVLVLAGEPGIGKTRLLLAAAQQAVSRGWSVLFGGCQRRGGQDPYAPVLEALVNHIRPRRPEQLSADLEGCAWLVRLLPELAGMLDPLPGGTLAPAQERRLIFEAIQCFLTNTAGPAGMLLILDDLQWAGPDALDLMNTLARVTALPLCIVGAYRDTELQPADPLNFLLADLAQAGLVRLHPLGPLDLQDAATLLDDLLTGMTDQDRAAAAPVLERAGGMPFFLVSYAQAVQAGAVEAVPWDIAQGVRQRLALLPEAARQLLGVAAIVGRRVPRVLLTAAAGQSEEDVPAGLEAVCRARLLVEEGDDAYAFAHDVIREVVEADLGAARRAMLHGRVAAALEGTPAARPELLAHHFIGSGDEAKAVRYLELAGDRAWSERAHVAAEGRYSDAVDRLEHLGRARDAVRVREKLGDVLYGAGRYDAALGVLERAADTYDGADDLEALARVTAALGWAHSLRGTTPAGIARITALLERLERAGASPPSLAKLYEALGWLLFTAGRYDASLAAGERAATLARARGDERTVALAEENRINVLQMLGRLGDALRVGRAVLPLAERVGDLECLWRTHIDMAYTYVLRADFASGRSAFDRALALAQQVGNPTRLAFTLALRSWIAVLSGDLTNARVDLDRAASVSNQTDHSWYSVYLPIFLARLFLLEGASDPAATQARDALAISEQSGDLQARRLASTIMAEIDILESRPEAARARLLPLLDRPDLQECDVTLLLPVLAWAHLELDQVDLAAETVEQALARARPEEMQPVLVEALRVRAMIALRQEQWDEVASSLEEGLALARSMPYPFAEARLRELEGLLQAQAGDGDAAGVPR